MSNLNVTNITIDKNPATFLDPIILNITFECLKDIEGEDIDWELIYVGKKKISIF